MKTVITTAGRTNPEYTRVAKDIAADLCINFIDRNKKSVEKIQKEQLADVLVVGKERLEFFAYGSTTPFFFHPNSAAFRLKRLLKAGKDPFLEATGLKLGERFLDTTAGLCSDSLIAAYTVGDPGKVVALEKEKMIAYIINRGLKSYETDFSELENSMRRIQVIHQDAVDFLKTVKDNSFDVVYMDPMFEEEIAESNNFQALREIGAIGTLYTEWVEQAKRVAKKRVVLKAHFRSPMFEDFGFTRLTRLSSKFHYGIIEV
ncbi:class I SAM-dependent methyltransferase [uncultured Psychrobacillus sp.]|uniref:class I SAM-dependent methyltransferase n=1 Tax=uncultured Psychrobacillus sp. TaxID=1551585 RepID=UPI00261CF50F|nr:class I SAM-dependent methyltransferase [uncultured Psychrobacillus sp.]